MATEPLTFRDNIARKVSITVLIATLCLGGLGIAFAAVALFRIDGVRGVDKAGNILQYVFTALLPLWGTWIGTVLAYYFAKENFESANKNVRELVNQVATSADKLKSLNVAGVMMPFDKMKRIDVPSGTVPDTLTVKSVYDQVIAANIRRALIFQEKKAIYALHKSLLSDYLFQKNGDQTLKLSDMKQSGDKDIKNAFENGTAFLSKSATLLDAKNLMDNLIGCQDVFITENGKRDEEVLGWISNIDILNNSKA